MPGGRPWNTGVNAGVPVTTTALILEDDKSVDGLVKTGGNVMKARKDKKAFKDKSGANRGLGTRTVTTETDISQDVAKPKPEGWIWRLGTMMDELSTDEIRRWSDESDSVTWFRSEAEMQRWQEEVEIRQADFLRCIRAFGSLSTKWTQLAKMNEHSPGRVAYAKKTSARYAVLQKRAKDLFCSAGYKSRLEKCEEDTVLLADLIHQDREDESSSLLKDLEEYVCLGENENNI